MHTPQITGLVCIDVELPTPNLRYDLLPSRPDGRGAGLGFKQPGTTSNKEEGIGQT